MSSILADIHTKDSGKPYTFIQGSVFIREFEINLPEYMAQYSSRHRSLELYRWLHLCVTVFCVCHT
jgi:hypothetical protein